MTDSLPASLRPLFEASGPALKYRIARDLAGRDESFFETLELRRSVELLDEVQDIIAARQSDGVWGGSLEKTEFAMLRLCELGLEKTRVVDETMQKTLLPALGKVREYDQFPPHYARDVLLRMIARGASDTNPLVTAMLEAVLIEWEQSLVPQAKGASPTLPGYAALCWHRWNDDELERVSAIVLKVLAAVETQEPRENFALRIWDKEYYLSHPEQLLYELELSARLGITHSCNATRWMFDEVESRQDADGWVRFDVVPDNVAPDGSPLFRSDLPWYYPLDTNQKPELDHTFRAALIFKLLEYDF